MPRIETALKVSYAKDLADISTALAGVDADYLLLRNHDFDAENFQNPQFGKPLGVVLQEIAAHNQGQWFFSEILKMENPDTRWTRAGGD